MNTKNRDYQFEIRVNGIELLRGDLTSVSVLFGNLDGSNFGHGGIQHQSHDDWLIYMSGEFKTLLSVGDKVEMLTPEGDYLGVTNIGKSIVKEVVGTVVDALAGNTVLISNYMSDGPGYCGPLLCHIGPNFVQVVRTKMQDINGNLSFSQIKRTEAFEADAPIVESVLDWEDKYAQMIFDQLDASSKEYCESPEQVDSSRTAIVRWSDGSLGAIMFWGESCYISALAFEGKWKGEFFFDLDGSNEILFVSKKGAVQSVIVSPSQEYVAAKWIDVEGSWIYHPVHGFTASKDMQMEVQKHIDGLVEKLNSSISGA